MLKSLGWLASHKTQSDVSTILMTLGYDPEPPYTPANDGRDSSTAPLPRTVTKVGILRAETRGFTKDTQLCRAAPPSTMRTGLWECSNFKIMSPMACSSTVESLAGRLVMSFLSREEMGTFVYAMSSAIPILRDHQSTSS